MKPRKLLLLLLACLLLALAGCDGEVGPIEIIVGIIGGLVAGEMAGAMRAAIDPKWKRGKWGTPLAAIKTLRGMLTGTSRKSDDTPKAQADEGDSSIADP